MNTNNIKKEGEDRKAPQYLRMAAEMLVPVITVLAVVGVIVGAFGLLSNAMGWHPVQGLAVLWQQTSHFWWLVLKVAGPAVLLGIVAMMAYDSDSKVGNVIAPLCSVLAVVSVVLTLIPTIRAENRRYHDIRHDAVVKVLKVEEADAPAYEPRTPYVLAERQLVRRLGNERGVELDGIWAFEVDGVQKVCGVLYPTRASYKRPVSGVACYNPQNGTMEKARFEGSVPSPKAMGAKYRLQHTVANTVKHAEYKSSDIYGYIKDGKPFMVVPMRVRTDGSTFTTVWAGALVFDSSGAAKHVKKVTDEVPGPIAGESMADEVLSAINSRGGFLDERRDRTTYDLAGEGANVRHFLLQRADGSGERLVTMLTPKKAIGGQTSDSNVAVLEIDARNISYKQWPKAVLYELPEIENQAARASIVEATDIVRSRYGATLQLANTQQNFVEPTLVGVNTLRITIAGAQEVTAFVEVNIADRSSCLYRANGEKVRCDQNGEGGILGNGNQNEGDTSSETPATGGAYSGMSKEQLQQEIAKLSDELNAAVKELASR